MKAGSYFYSLKLVSDKLKIDPELIVDEWLQHRVSLYMKLNSLPCRIIRYIGADSFLLKYEILKIKNGMDYYQHELMPEFKVRQFHPTKNTDIDARLINNDLGISRFTYSGYAYGYWRLKPTKTAHFLKEKIISPGLNIVLSDNEVLESITIHGRDDSDYLILSNEASKILVEVYVDSKSFDFLQNYYLLSDEVEVSKDSIDYNYCDIKKSVDSIPFIEHYRAALYIFIHEWWGAGSSEEVVINKLVTHLEMSHQLKVKHSTVKRWAEKPQINAKYRSMSDQKKVLSILISEYCSTKNIKKESMAVASLLNEFINSEKYCFNCEVTFSELEVATWII